MGAFDGISYDARLMLPVMVVNEQTISHTKVEINGTFLK